MATLPKKFKDLEAWADWALPTERSRCEKRRASSPEELREFYEALKPRVEDALEHLDRKGLDELSGKETRLLHLTLMLAEAAFAVEKYRAVGKVPLGVDLNKFVPLHDL